MAAQMTLEQAAALTTATADLVMTGRYCTLTAWILLLWDHIAHLDKEIELFWYKPWNVAKILYFFNRYNALIFVGVHAMIFLSPNVSDKLCLGWFKFEGYTGTIGIASVELILGFRVLALWNGNKWIICIVGFAVFAEITTMLSILSSAYVQLQAISQLDPSIPYKACIPLNVPPYFFAFWLPPLGYEFLVFVLAALKGFHTLRYSFSWRKGDFTFRSTGSRLLEVMIRDSLWYFLLIFACDMVCSLIWLKGPDSLLQAVVGFGLVIPSVAASHLLLNLRDAYHNPPDPNLTTENSTWWTASAYNKGGGGGKKPVSTFGRLKNIVASGGRHHVAQLDTRWALDPDQDDSTVREVDNEQSKFELVPIDGEGHAEGMEAEYETKTIPTGSRRARRLTQTITTTTATVSTGDGVESPRYYPDATPMTKASGADAYVYTARQLNVGGSRRGGGGGGYDLEAGEGLAVADSSSLSRQSAAAGDEESYELRHVSSNGSVV